MQTHLNTENHKTDTVKNPVTKIKTEAEIQDWIVAYIAALLEITDEQIDVTIPFDRYGLDSSAAVGMTGDLEAWLGYELDATLLYDYPTIEMLSKYLFQKINSQS